ncbi:MAG: hypothetical protein HRU07_01880 [Nitrosopumilus sp.]|nr:hypothetical protein [Nitrosopumilus sp.]NRA04923.1 hypothetical protein [Nitrosopumilus sp.]
MNSLDTLMFLMMANEKGILNKDESLKGLKILEEIGFRFLNGIKTDYIKRLK